MAQTTYYSKVAITPAIERVACDRIATFFNHVPTYRTVYNARFVSLSLDAQMVLVLTLTNPLPATELAHFDLVEVHP